MEKSVGKMCRNWNSRILLVGVYKAIATVEKNLVVPQKVK